MSHSVRPSRLASPRRCAVAGSAVVLAIGLAGCGGDDDPPATAATGTTTASSAAPATTAPAPPTATGPVNGSIRPDPTTTQETETGTAVSGPAGDITVASGVDRRRGLRLAVATIDTLDEENLLEDDGTARVVLTVTRRAPVAVRRRLARTSGYNVACDLGGPGTSGVEIRPTGPRTAVAPGTVRRSDPFLEPAKGRTIRDTVKACFLYLSSEPRGSSRRSYASGDPDRAYATVRFR